MSALESPGHRVLREGLVHLLDEAEALQRYLHQSKLHSANKEKTNNEKNFDDTITGSSE